MKKVLFASTALIAVAGVAAAEVSIGGAARLGIAYTEGAADETVIESRLRFNIDADASSDNGLQFGGRIRIQSDDGGAAVLNGARLDVSAGGFKVEVGNIGGAIDNMPNYYGYEPGLAAFTGQYAGLAAGYDGHSSTGAGRNGVNVGYKANGFQGMISYSDTAGIERTAFMIGYDFGDYTAAIGYQDSNIDADDQLIVGTFGGSVGNFDFAIYLADEDAGTAWGVSGKFGVGAATDIVASIAGNDDDEFYGIGFVHDLGGGAAFAGGIGENAGTQRGDLGMKFSF